MKQVVARLSGIAIACTISLAAQAAVAQSEAQLKIPAGELIPALKSLATQLDIELVYQPEQLRNMRTDGVQGNYSAQQATAILLKGTPLEVRTDVSGAMVIAPAIKQPSARTAQPALSRIRLAQVSTPPASSAAAENPASSPQLEEIVVTGTLIRGLEQPTGSNLVSVSEEQIQATGVSSAVELLNRTVTQLPSFNSLPSGTADFGTATTRIGLRGIGTTTGTAAGQSATLVLFNGHRIVPVGILSTDPDPNLIPSDLLAGVEVMPDGGSATYGSDAIGGVVNFITRKRFDGVQFHGQQGMAEDYNETNGSLTGGTSWDRGSAVLSLAYTNHDALFGKDRDYATSDFTAHGGQDFRSTTCEFGTFTVNGQLYTGASSAPASARPKCDPTDYTSIYPSEKRYTAFGYIEQELSDTLKFSMDAFYSARETKIYTDTASIPVSMTITNANPAFRPVAGETSQTVAFNYVRAIGPFRTSKQDFDEYQFSPRLDWRLSDDWNVRADFIYGRSDATNRDRRGLNGAAINANNVNPYDPALTDPSLLATLVDNEFYNQGVNTLTSGQLVANGSLFTLPGGDVQIGVGSELRRQELKATTFQGAIDSFAGVREFPVHRTVTAGFAELQVPIVGHPNAMTGVQSLDFNVALRYDDYSDFGGTTNPRFGLDYKPFDDLRLRANYQTSFVAPSLADSGNKVDTRLQLATLAPNVYRAFIAGAGVNLKPQEAKTFSFGADWTPEQIDGLSVSTTYWRTRIDNLVSQALSAFGGSAAASATPYNVCGSGFQTLVPSSSGPCSLDFLTSLQDIFVRIDNAAAPGVRTLSDLFAPGVTISAVIDARRNNFGSAKLEGIDSNVSYGHDVGNGRIVGEVGGTYNLKRDISSLAGGVFIDYLSGGAVQAAPRYNVFASISASSGPFNGRLTVSHNAGVDIPLARAVAINQTHIESFTVADLFLSATLGDITVLKDTALEFAVTNLLDEEPPYSGAQPNAQASGGFENGGTLGRMFRLGLRTKF
ncbi:TonB-dependent receptor domain-containing protein [Steroidobacter flavus]|uniref:TonB-dependent receptor domain-containing protein n=2 Tax=Steroidobacter flavus TaxID=1842136 RepID=A0ABV8T1P8_9GAMM